MPLWAAVFFWGCGAISGAASVRLMWRISERRRLVRGGPVPRGGNLWILPTEWQWDPPRIVSSTTIEDVQPH